MYRKRYIEVGAIEEMPRGHVARRWPRRGRFVRSDDHPGQGPSTSFAPVRRIISNGSMYVAPIAAQASGIFTRFREFGSGSS